MSGWTRREVLTSAAGATVAGWVGRLAGQTAVKWSAGTERPRLEAPPLAADCHHHIYDARFPPDPSATLRPPDALVDDYRALQARLGTTRHVVVQPSTYGVDNRCLLDALAAFGATARGVAVVNDAVGDAELARLDRLGVRGLRFNLAQAGATTVDMIEPLARRIHDLGWHVQVNASAARIQAILPVLDRVPVPVVFDHLAQIPEPAGVAHPLVADLRRRLDAGRIWIKLTGVYGQSRVGPPTYSDAGAVARAYVQAAPERLVWGTDWPHPTEREKPDDAALFDLLLDWAPDAAVRHRILVENPAALYRF